VGLRVLRQTVRAAASAFEQVGLLRLMVYHGFQFKEALRWNTDTGDETSYWTAKLVAELDTWSGTIDRYLRWMEILSRASDELVRSLGADAVSLRRQVLLSCAFAAGSCRWTFGCARRSVCVALFAGNPSRGCRTGSQQQSVSFVRRRLTPQK
jgi:hypothetical protein